MSESLVFHESPLVEFGGNFFQRVPTILQFEDTPMIEVVKVEEAGFSTQFSIYHRDGTYLAKVKGSQMYLTEPGKKAGLTLRHPGAATVCEMNGSPLFELRRSGPAALKSWAELYTPTGVLVKGTAHDLATFGIDASGNQTKIGGLLFSGNVLNGAKIGLLVQKDGGIIFGAG